MLNTEPEEENTLCKSTWDICHLAACSWRPGLQLFGADVSHTERTLKMKGLHTGTGRFTWARGRKETGEKKAKCASVWFVWGSSISLIFITFSLLCPKISSVLYLCPQDPVWPTSWLEPNRTYLGMQGKVTLGCFYEERQLQYIFWYKKHPSGEMIFPYVPITLWWDWRG